MNTRISHHIPSWVYWLVQSVIIIVCTGVWLTGCDSIPQLSDTNPWELAHERCSELPELDAAKCHLGVAVAHDACNHGVKQLGCPEGVDPAVCNTVNSTLKALCEQPAPRLEAIQPEAM